jgi:thioredoxin-like negative regulator of GroEL
VADAAGDVDGYCAAQQLMGPRVRDDAGMARRLLEAGRPADALAALTAAEPNPAKNAAELADLHITVLDALGRTEEAQALDSQIKCST